MRLFWLGLLSGCGAASLPAAQPGELTLMQLDLRGWIGEAMGVVGPDGTTVLLDVGNDGHGEDVAAAVQAATGGDRVDVVLLTHYHADHIGGLPGLLDAGIGVGALVDRGDVHLEAAADELDEVRERSMSHVSLCSETACDLPWTLDLGDGATLTVFAADGEILGQRFPDTLPDDDDGENARSLAGVVRWGDFSYVFSGDLGGGGKGTPDVESFYAAHAPTSLALDAELLHLGHHGIDSSSYAPWLSRWLSEGFDHAATTGTNGSYLDAPADEVLDRLRGRLGDGAVWVPQAGSLAGEDPLLVVADGPVVVRVSEDGASWQVEAAGEVTGFVSHPDGG